MQNAIQLERPKFRGQQEKTKQKNRAPSDQKKKKKKRKTQVRAVTVKGQASNLGGIQMPGLKNRLSLCHGARRRASRWKGLSMQPQGAVCPAMVPLLGLVALPGHQIKTRPLGTLPQQVCASQCVNMKRGCGQGHWEDMLKRRRRQED